MHLYRESAAMAPIFSTLWQLGITPNYRGYYYAAYATLLCAQQPEALLLITKFLYPDVAKRYQTNWKCVERNLRTVIDIAWNHDPELLSRLAGCTLTKKPCCAQFISILSRTLTSPTGAEADEFPGPFQQS